MDAGIKAIDEHVFNKFAKTAVTYYSPQRNFVYLRIRKSLMAIELYTGEKTIKGVKNQKNHENWGTIRVRNESDLKAALEAIRRSHKLIQSAIASGINTGWYAVTPKEKMSWVKSDSSEAESDE